MSTAPSSPQNNKSYNFAMATGIISIGLFLLTGLITLVTSVACTGVYECGLGWITLFILFVYFVIVAPILTILTIIGIVLSAKLSSKRGVCLALNITGLSLNLGAGLFIILSYIH